MLADPTAWSKLSAEVQTSAEARYAADPEFATQLRSAWLEALDDAYYHDTRTRTWRGAPTFVREDPLFAAAVIRSGTSWLPPAGERASVDALLTSLDFLCDGQLPLDALRHVPAALLEQPRVRASVASQLEETESPARAFRNLPAPLHLDVGCARVALAADPRSALEVIPLESASRALHRLAANAARTALAGGLRWSHVPALLRQDPSVSIPALEKTPALVGSLSEAERAHTVKLFADEAWVMSALEHLEYFARALPANLTDDQRVVDAAARAVEADLDVARKLGDALAAKPEVIAATATHQRPGRRDAFAHLPAGAVTEDAVALILERGVDKLPTAHVLIGPQLDRAVALAEAALRNGTSLASLSEQLRARVDLRRVVLEAHGHDVLERQLGPDAARDPALWSSVSPARVREYLTDHPERLRELPPSLARDRGHILTAIESSEPRLQGLVLRQLPRELLDDAEFVDPLIAVVPSGFRFASERLRASADRAQIALLGSTANFGAERVTPAERAAIFHALAARAEEGAADTPAAERAMLRRVADGHRTTSGIIGRAAALAAMELRASSAALIEPHLLLESGFLEETARRAPAALASLPTKDLAEPERAEVRARLRAMAADEPALFSSMPYDIRADRALVASLIDRSPEVITSAAGDAQADAELWLRAARVDASVLGAVDIERTLGKQLCREPNASALRDVALEQLASRTLPPPPGLPGVLIRGPHSDAVVAAALRAYGGDAVAGLADGWFDHAWARTAFSDAVRADPARAAAGLTSLPRKLAAVLSDLEATPQGARAARAFAIELLPRLPGAFELLPSPLRADPLVFRAALEGGSRAGGIRGLDAIVSRASPEILDLVTRDGRTDAAYARAIADALDAAREAGIKTGWLITAFGAVEEVALERALVRDHGLSARVGGYSMLYRAEQIAALQVGGERPPAPPEKPPSTESLVRRAASDTAAAWEAQLRRQLRQSQRTPHTTLTLVDRDWAKRGPFRPEELTINADGSVVGPDVAIAAEDLVGLDVLYAPPRPPDPSIERRQLTRASVGEGAWPAQVVELVRACAGDPTARVWLGTPSSDGDRGPLRADGLRALPEGTALVVAGARGRADDEVAIADLCEVRVERRAMPPEVREANERRAAHVAQMRLEIVRRSPQELTAVPEAERTLALWRTAAAGSVAQFRDAPAEVKADRDVVRRVLRLDGQALRYAAPELRADPEVVGWAVATAAKAYEHATEPLALPTDADARAHIRALFEAGDSAGAEAAARALVGPPDSVRRALYLRYVREVRLPSADVPLLADPDVALAAAANDNELRDHWSYVRDRLRADPAYVDAFVAAAPGWLRTMPPECILPRHVEQVALQRGTTWIFEAKSFHSSPPPGVTPTALDPRVSVPPERWQRLAEVNPTAFVEAFTLEAVPNAQHGALRTAYLAALAQDHRLLDRLPKELTGDLSFLAAVVRVAPLAWRSLSPAEQALLEVQSPHEVAHAREFLDRLERSGLRKLHRFDGHDRLLQRVLDDRFAPHGDPRPLATVVLARDDHNDAFVSGTTDLEALLGRYRVALYEASSVEELAASVRDATRDKPADVVILGGHGTQTSLRLGRADEPDSLLRADDLDRLRALGLHSRIATGGRVALMSCSSGKLEDLARNTVNTLSNLWPQATVSGQSTVSGSRLRVDESGLFAGLRYTYERAYVPAYEIPQRVE